MAPGLVRSPWKDVLSTLKDAIHHAPGVSLDLGTFRASAADANYLIPTLHLVQDLALRSPSSELKYVPETMDCDDFVDVAVGFMAQQGYGNLSIGKASFSIFAGDEFRGSHAALIGITSEGIGWWEPQTDKLYPLSHKWIGGSGVTDYVITGLVF